MNENQDVGELVENLRQNSPLTVLLGTILASLVLALSVNLLSSVLYDLWTTLGPAVLPAASPAIVRLLCAAPALFLSTILGITSCIYLYTLSRRQRPGVRRVITLILPFVVNQGKARLLEIPRLHASAAWIRP